MNAPTFDTHALRGAEHRRRLLLTLGSMGLAAALARPSAAPAAKKAKKTCKREKSQCRQAVRQRCGANQSCLDSFLQCCETCKVGRGVICVLSQP